MEDKHALTEKLKVIETEIFDDRIDLEAINRELNVAYDYESELAERMNVARKKTEEIRKDFFIISTRISERYQEMKNIFDIFTGNFYGR